MRAGTNLTPPRAGNKESRAKQSKGERMGKKRREEHRERKREKNEIRLLLLLPLST